MGFRAGHIQALARRARVHEQLGHLEQAIRDQDRVVDLCREAKELSAAQPDCATAFSTVTRWRARRSAAAGLAESAKAWADWKQVLAQEPGDAEATRELPWLWIIRRCTDPHAGHVPPLDDDAKLALACAQSGYDAEPENFFSARNLGIIHVHFGRFAEARPLLLKALRLAPESSSSALHLALIEHHQGDGSEARRLLEKTAEDIRKIFPAGSADRQLMEAILGFAERALSRPAPAERP